MRILPFTVCQHWWPVASVVVVAAMSASISSRFCHGFFDPVEGAGVCWLRAGGSRGYRSTQGCVLSSAASLS